MIWVYTTIGSILYLVAFCLVYEGIKEHTTWPGRRPKYSKPLRLLGALFWPLLGFYQISTGLFSLVTSTVSDIFTPSKKDDKLYFTINGNTAHCEENGTDLKSIIYGLIYTGGRCGIFIPEKKLFYKFRTAIEELQKEADIRVLTFSSDSSDNRWPFAYNEFLILPKAMEVRDWHPNDAIPWEYISNVS